MRLTQIFGAAALLAASAIAANAATFQTVTETFDLTIDHLLDGKQTAYDFTSGSGNTNLSITAGRYTTLNGVMGGYTAGVKQFTGSGVGVCALKNQQSNCGLAGETSNRDLAMVDGAGYNELAVFNFDRNVSLQSVSFGSVGAGSNAMFDLFTNDGTSWSQLATDLNSGGSGALQNFNFASIYNGTSFGIGAKDAASAFLITSVTVTYQQLVQGVPEVSAVPLPAGGLLLLTGIAGLGIARRRKKA